MLTARDTQQDRITGFETGADDYLVKPFDIRELAARVQALVRRRRGNVAAEVLRVADLTFDTGTLQAQRKGTKLNLTPTALRITFLLQTAAIRWLPVWALPPQRRKTR